VLAEKAAALQGRRRARVAYYRVGSRQAPRFRCGASGFDQAEAPRRRREEGLRCRHRLARGRLASTRQLAASELLSRARRQLREPLRDADSRRHGTTSKRRPTRSASRSMPRKGEGRRAGRLPSMWSEAPTTGSSCARGLVDPVRSWSKPRSPCGLLSRASTAVGDVHLCGPEPAGVFPRKTCSRPRGNVGLQGVVVAETTPPRPGPRAARSRLAASSLVASVKVSRCDPHRGAPGPQTPCARQDRHPRAALATRSPPRNRTVCAVRLSERAVDERGADRMPRGTHPIGVSFDQRTGGSSGGQGTSRTPPSDATRWQDDDRYLSGGFDFLRIIPLAPKSPGSEHAAVVIRRYDQPLAERARAGDRGAFLGCSTVTTRGGVRDRRVAREAA